MATKPVQIEEKMHKRLKIHSARYGETMGQTMERFIKEGLVSDKLRG